MGLFKAMTLSHCTALSFSLGLTASTGFSPGEGSLGPLCSHTSDGAVALLQDTATHCAPPPPHRAHPAIPLCLPIKECFASHWGGVALTHSGCFFSQIFSVSPTTKASPTKVRKRLFLFPFAFFCHIRSPRQQAQKSGAAGMGEGWENRGDTERKHQLVFRSVMYGISLHCSNAVM